MNALQNTMAALLLDGEHPILVALREQWAVATVKWDSIEGASYSLYVDVPSSSKPLFAKGRADISDVHAEISGLSAPAKLELIIVDGRIRALRGTMLNDEPWAENAEIERCFYVARDGDSIETSARDVEMALSEVLERQSDPVRPYLDDLLELVGDNEHYGLVDQLVPLHDEAETVQGEVLRAALRIRSEFDREGCGNWPESPEFYGEFVQFLLEHLCDGTFGMEVEAFTRELLFLVRKFGEAETQERSSEDKRVLIRDLEYLDRLAAAWCLRHPELIQHRIDKHET